ncbi:hypothetical protein [Roseovarius pelagicus]|uniref:Uncharacterized protein n=1 Tax=Roseovarius pelagicus TaxID=2980108 RepID=A0ABY6DCE3_9RHOB|nr:hypothetical protein [Roseovarius pelagicus]UXX83797.1 hypothetical protein N7U68_03815 [Roseovarius pelagicus]
MAKSMTTGLSSKRLDKREAVFDRPFPKRWFWFWQHRKASRSGRRLANAKPMAVGRYDAATARMRNILARQRRQLRSQIAVLRLRILVSSVWGFLKRYWRVLLVLSFVAACATASYVYWKDILALADRLADRLISPPAPTSTTPTQPPTGQNP